MVFKLTGKHPELQYNFNVDCKEPGARGGVPEHRAYGFFCGCGFLEKNLSVVPSKPIPLLHSGILNVHG